MFLELFTYEVRLVYIYSYLNISNAIIVFSQSITNISFIDNY